MANRTDVEAASVHGTNPQNLVEKIIRSKIYETMYWKEHCFAVNAETIVDKTMDLKAVGGAVFSSCILWPIAAAPIPCSIPEYTACTNSCTYFCSCRWPRMHAALCLRKVASHGVNTLSLAACSCACCFLQARSEALGCHQISCA